jgi:hypothetical protein
MDLLSELKRLDETMSPAPLLATVDPKREYAWIREADGTFLHSPLGMNPDDAEGFVALRNLLPALIASVPSARERRLEEALRESLNMLVKRGQHAKRCPQVVNGITPCSCGLDEAITAARVALEGK